VHSLNIELTDAKQHADHLERDNAGLYAELADLRLTAKKVAALELCESRLSSAETQATVLQERLATQSQEMAVMLAHLEEVRSENAELQEINRHLQTEVKRLLERSTLNLVELCKFMKLQSLLQVATFPRKLLRRYLFLWDLKSS